MAAGAKKRRKITTAMLAGMEIDIPSGDGYAVYPIIRVDDQWCELGDPKSDYADLVVEAQGGFITTEAAKALVRRKLVLGEIFGSQPVPPPPEIKEVG